MYASAIIKAAMKRIFPLMCLLLCGCLTPRARMNLAMDSWMGHTPDELIAKFGPPSQILMEGDAKIYVFSETTLSTQNRAPVVMNRGTKNKPIPLVLDAGGSVTTENTNWRMFWVKQDRVFKWAWKGL